MIRVKGGEGVSGEIVEGIPQGLKKVSSSHPFYSHSTMGN